ncbi:hypothetical protein HN51_045658 [Arachis hypogaea]
MTFIPGKQWHVRNGIFKLQNSHEVLKHYTEAIDCSPKHAKSPNVVNATPSKGPDEYFFWLFLRKADYRRSVIDGELRKKMNDGKKMNEEKRSQSGCNKHVIIVMCVMNIATKEEWQELIQGFEL